MAQPLSFVASVVGVASLAGTVATKGYQYLKAVKDCPNEVRGLIVEINILCGILGRLVVLLKGQGAIANSQNCQGENIEAECEHDEQDTGSLDIGEESEAVHSYSRHSFNPQ